jgi:hypothetical protein
MRKIYLIIASIVCVFQATGQQYPTSLPHHVVSGISTIHLRYDHCLANPSCYNNQDKVNAEVPPWIIPGGWRSYFIVNGKQTNIFSTPESMVDHSEIDFKNDAIGPYLAADPDLNKHWKRNYNNIWSAHYYVHPVQQGISLGYLHSENKNWASNCNDPSTYIINTINPTVQINCNDHYTWSDNNADGWLAYHSFVTAAWTHNNQSTNWGQQYFENELGPIVWPANGYVTNSNIVASNGPGGPSSIIVGDYIYVFFLDVGVWGDHLSQEEGRGRGIRVLKVHKNDALDPSQYRVYYKDPSGNEFWNPSLPAGFTKETMLQYVKIQGPKGTDILHTNGQTASIRFSVAHVENTSYFIGVEEYIDLQTPCNDTEFAFKAAIRFSDDLVNWSDRILQIGDANCWTYFNMRYPIFLNANGWTNTEINLNDFYILGTRDVDNYVNKIHVYYYIPPPPPPPPPPCPPGVFCEITDAKGGTKPLPGVKAIGVFPNPATSVTNIQFAITEDSRVRILLFDVNGRLVKRVDDKFYVKGTYTKQVDLSERSPGVYLLQIMVGNASSYLKVVKL